MLLYLEIEIESSCITNYMILYTVEIIIDKAKWYHMTVNSGHMTVNSVHMPEES